MKEHHDESQNGQQDDTFPKVRFPPGYNNNQSQFKQLTTQLLVVSHTLFSSVPKEPQ